MPSISVNCDQCGVLATLNFGQGGMGWFESFHCESCGCRWESDGPLPMPEPYRKAIIAEEGQWLLELVQPASPQLLNRVRNALQLSLEQLLELKRSVPVTLLVGTRFEIENFRSKLEDSPENVSLRMRRTNS